MLCLSDLHVKLLELIYLVSKPQPGPTHSQPLLVHLIPKDWCYLFVNTLNSIIPQNGLSSSEGRVRRYLKCYWISPQESEGYRVTWPTIHIDLKAQLGLFGPCLLCRGTLQREWRGNQKTSTSHKLKYKVIFGSNSSKYILPQQIPSRLDCIKNVQQYHLHFNVHRKHCVIVEWVQIEIKIILRW